MFNFIGRPLGSSAYQKGIAAEARSEVPYPMKNDLNEIVHSGDKEGKYSQMPNHYRDLTNSYDPNAQIVIDAALQYIKNK